MSVFFISNEWYRDNYKIEQLIKVNCFFYGILFVVGDIDELRQNKGKHGY